MSTSDLSKKVKELRSKNGLVQEQLAEASGLSLRTIQRIENGETIPRGDTLKRLAAALQVSSDEILSEQIFEDKNLLLILNISQLAFLIFPLLGIIIPLVIWILKKGKVKGIDTNGKSILNFQITWTFIFYSFCLLLAFFFIFPKMFSANPNAFSEVIHLFNILYLTVGVFYIINICLIGINTIKTFRGQSLWYKPSFKFLH